MKDVALGKGSFARPALDQLDQLDDRDDEEAQSYGGGVFGEGDGSEAEGRSEDGDLTDRRGGDQRGRGGDQERRFRLWKTSAIEMVRKAIVMPALLSAMPKEPLSM